MGVDNALSRPRQSEKGYIPAVLGAYLGGLVIGGPSAFLALLAAGWLAFSDVPDAVLIAITTIGATGVVVGSALGTTWMLRRRQLAAATTTGAILVILLTVLFLVGSISSGTEAQSSLFVPLAVAATATPLVARWLTIHFRSHGRGHT